MSPASILDTENVVKNKNVSLGDLRRTRPVTLPPVLRSVVGAACAALALSLPAVAAAATPAPPEATAAAKAQKGPSKQLVLRDITGMFDAVYREGWMTGDELSITFDGYRALPSKMQKIDGGHYAKPIRVWPIRVNVLIRVDRGVNGITETKRGWWNTQFGGNEVFTFYRDSNASDGWSFVTSRAN